MAYYGIITDVEQDEASIRVTWEMRDDADANYSRGSTFTFDCPATGTRAELREEISAIALSRIRPFVESARAAQSHLPAIKAQLVGRRWPSQ